MSDGAYCFVGISVSACASSRTPVPASIAATQSEAQSEAQRDDMTPPGRARLEMGKGILREGDSPLSLLQRCGGMPCIAPLDSGAGQRDLPVELLGMEFSVRQAAKERPDPTGRGQHP